MFITSHHSASSYRNHSITHKTLISIVALVYFLCHIMISWLQHFSCFPSPYDLIYPSSRIKLNYYVVQFRLCDAAHSFSKCHTRFCSCVSHQRCEKTFVSSTAPIMAVMHADHLYYTPYANAGSRVARANSHIMVAHKLYYLMGTPMCETFRGS